MANIHRLFIFTAILFGFLSCDNKSNPSDSEVLRSEISVDSLDKIIKGEIAS